MFNSLFLRVIVLIIYVFNANNVQNVSHLTYNKTLKYLPIHSIR